MGQEQFETVEFPAELFFARNNPVNLIVTFTAEFDRLGHFLSTMPFAKPLVAMASARNQVVGRGASLGDSPTHFTRSVFFPHA